MSPLPTATLLDYEARIVSLLGAIGEGEINLLIDLLLRCDSESGTDITLYLSSQGGDVLQALKVIDTLRLLRSHVTAVGLGLVEGAAVVVLAACPRRVVFPSVLISTAGLWALPMAHADLREPMGLGGGSDPRHQLLAKVQQQVERSFANAPQNLRSLLANPAQPPRLFNAAEAIEVGFADHIITGPQRRLLKPQTKKLSYAKSITL